MTPSARKAAVEAYKRQPVIAGVFAVICTATGEAWVGKSRRIDAEQNGLWFSLRMGSSPFKALQAVWSAHSPEDFRFEILDLLPEDISTAACKDELARRAKLWIARLQAHAL